MRIVSESIKHLTPRANNDLYNSMLEEIHYKEIAHLITNEFADALCCLYCWDNNIVTCKYFGNLKLALKQYLKDAIATVQEVEEDKYTIHRIFSLYTIDPTQPGTFSDDNGPIGTGGIKIIFDIEFHNHKVFFSTQ